MPNIVGRRGFVTIATGKSDYYKLARNLMHSYKMHTKNPYPFAIIADRENEFTAEFDEVVIINNPSNSYNDKLRLFEYLPFEETIFIDADSLAYGDLNEWWEIFEKAGDFSLFGYAYRDIDTATRWFKPSGMKEFADKVSFVPDFNGGIYYLRNTDTCGKVFELANYCAKHYYEYSFAGFKDPADEPVLALGMAVCNCEPVNKDEHVFAPGIKFLDVDITVPKAVCSRKGITTDARLIHWSSYLTKKAFYRFEVAKMEKALSGRKRIFDKLLYDYKIKYYLMHIYDVQAFAGRVIRKLKREIRKIKKSLKTRK